MPNQKIGQMKFVDGEWRVRLSVYTGPKKRERQWFGLGTADETLATLRVPKLVDELALVPRNRAARQPAPKPGDLPLPLRRASERFTSYARAWQARREAEGIAFAESETIYLEKHILPVALPAGEPAATFGELLLPDVRQRHVKLVLRLVRDADYSPQQVRHVRGTISRVLSAAVEDELISENVVDKVSTPKPKDPKKAIRRPRVALRNDEIDKLFACDDVDLELRLMGFCARVQGGMRTRDITAWTWEMIDTQRFVKCTVPRTKTLAPQELPVPTVLQAPLRRWWVSQGCPTTGPVFPITKGKRKGEPRRTRGVSFADRLRRALVTASVFRLPPVEVPERKAGRRTDLGKKPTRMVLGPDPRDPLHFDTETSRAVDFHSFRRAFKTGLAEAGISTERAMLLSGSSDPRTHARYIVATPDMLQIPEAALPKLKGTAKGTGANGEAFSSSGTRGSNPRPSAWEAGAQEQEATISDGCDDQSRHVSIKDPRGSAGSDRQGDGKGTRGSGSRVKDARPVGIVRAETRGADAATVEGEMRDLFEGGVVLAIRRAGDPRWFDEAETILARLEELRVAAGGRRG